MTRFEDMMLLERINEVYTQLNKDIDTLVDEYFKYFGLVDFDVDIEKEKRSLVRAITCKIDKAFIEHEGV